MLNKLSYQIRLIAETEIIKNCGNVKITKVDSPLYDFLVTDKGQGLKFGVFIVSNYFSRTNDFKDYILLLQSVDYSLECNHLPIVLMSVNESARTASIGYVLAWHHGRPRIYPNVTLRQSNEKTWGLVLDQLLSMDEIIRILHKDGVKILKHFIVEFENSGRSLRGDVMYLRSFSEAYKMKSKEVVNEKETFSRLAFGIPETDYPSDYLDDCIESALSNELTIIDKRSSVLLFNTELRDLQNYNTNYYKSTASVIIEPDANDLLCLSSVPSIPSSRSYSIEVYTLDSDASNYYNGKVFHVSQTLDVWIRDELSQLSNSYHPLSSIFI